MQLLAVCSLHAIHYLSSRPAHSSHHLSSLSTSLSPHHSRSSHSIVILPTKLMPILKIDADITVCSLHATLFSNLLAHTSIHLSSLSTSQLSLSPHHSRSSHPIIILPTKLMPTYTTDADMSRLLTA